MTLLEQLRAHVGGLVRIKSQLYWYGRGWDGVHDRVCLLMDTTPAVTPAATTAARAPTAASPHATTAAAALLIVDGAPHWVWIGQEDVVLLRPVDRHDTTPLTTQAEVDAVLCGHRPKGPEEMAPLKGVCPF
jgi:hypothetical protein